MFPEELYTGQGVKEKDRFYVRGLHTFKKNYLTYLRFCFNAVVDPFFKKAGLCDGS